MLCFRIFKSIVKESTETEELVRQVSYTPRGLYVGFNPIHVPLESYTPILLSITELKVTFFF